MKSGFVPFRKRTLQIPGNLLLAGEYAILQQGGLGIAFAADIYAQAEIRTSKTFSLKGTGGGKSFHWPGDPFCRGLIEQLKKTFGALPPLDICIDTDSFYGEDGIKRGLGSSAVTALGVTWGFLDFFREAPTQEELYLTALDTCRSAQGGQGSGYDIAASLFGGTILFCGGLRPEITQVKLPWLPDPFFLSFATHSVSTSGAVQSYLRLPEAQRHRWMENSNGLVRKMLSAEDPVKAAELLSRYQQISRDLGQELGFPAERKRQSQEKKESQKEPSFSKCLGAGDELLWTDSPQEDSLSCRLDTEGLRVL